MTGSSRHASAKYGGAAPKPPRFIAFVFQGGVKKGDALMSIAASPNLTRRSGRTSALPYPVYE
ncbi:hypothetical protein Salpa_0966 [Sporomusa sp. KB1]|jgi:hypothetical protein|nr:hypothetical protein Salpa_0966 [Sporomusa sp. KB1]